MYFREASERIQPANGEPIDPRKVWQERSPEWLSHVKGETQGSVVTVRDFFLHPLMIKYLDIQPQMRILDAGCGDGILSALIRRYGGETVGIDIVESFLHESEYKKEQEVAVADITKSFPFIDGSFDRIVSNLTLMWLDDYSPFVRESFRVLNPGGKVIVSLAHPFTAIAERVPPEHPDFPILVQKLPLNEGRYLRLINRVIGPYPYYQRSPFEYVNRFLQEGFMLIAGEDTFLPDNIDIGPDSPAYRMFPQFLILVFQKPKV